MPLALVGLLITGEGGAIEITRVALPVAPSLLVAVMLILEFPAADGIPEITPVEVLIVSPIGNPSAPKLVGALVAVMV